MNHNAKGGNYIINKMKKVLTNSGYVLIKINNVPLIVTRIKFLKELTIHGNTLKQLSTEDDIKAVTDETKRIISEADDKEKWKEFPEVYKNICIKNLEEFVV